MTIVYALSFVQTLPLAEMEAVFAVEVMGEYRLQGTQMEEAEHDC